PWNIDSYAFIFSSLYSVINSYRPGRDLAVRALIPAMERDAYSGNGISLGVAGFPDHGHDMEGLLRSADLALYRAKHQGRNRVEVFAAS
ncbi:MAG TPA: diguanylate cyclase, partial [Piscirickettsiaceae bacterium]|nr:diguanylate cyclase [Piscirickettsiaceae bacterium]